MSIRSFVAHFTGSMLLVAFSSGVTASSTVPADLNEGDISLRLGGVGGVYFLAEPGELVIDVQKEDLNRSSRKTHLRAILVAPDRELVQELLIPDDGLPRGSKIGPTQRIRFSTIVKQKGIYALNITVANDRYGAAMRWGFRTNCSKFLIETSRGHRDAAHEEPIVVDSPNQPGNICFVPQAGSFGIEMTGLAKSLDNALVFDADDRLVQSMQIDKQGKAACKFPSDKTRGEKPWRIHLDTFQATVHIDGVTRWDRNDAYQDLCCWSPSRETWFPLLSYRWLMTPYQRTIYQGGDQHKIQAFRIHNNSSETQTFHLDLVFPDQQWPAILSQDHVSLKPKSAAEVTVSFSSSVEQQTQTLQLRATPESTPHFSTYATLTVKAGEPPASSSLNMPITLKPYQHENNQFGYGVDYPQDNQVYFDLENRPYILSSRQLWRRVDGSWVANDLSGARREASVGDGAIRASGTKVAFDQDNDLYILGMCGRTAVLLHSSDHGASFAAFAIAGQENRSRSFDIEQFSGHNIPTGPPPIVRYTRTASDPKLMWRRIHNLDLFLPEKAKGQISIGDPIAISDHCIGQSAHSGIPSSVVSQGEKVHVVWGQATDPKQKPPGVPGYAVTYNRKFKNLSEPTLIGYGPPANDVHNSPSITIDGDGFLHLLIGTHGKPFPYAKSLKSNDTSTGWTATEPIADVRQTYVGLVTGQDGTLHAVYRMWTFNEQPHPESMHAVLAYSRKPAGQPWSTPMPLVVAAFSDYSIFYHRLTIDRTGRLWLSYDYWSTYWFYRNDHVGSRRSLLTSPDDGETWKLAGDDDWISLEN
ncbi:hypothetical protein CA13_01430 [Planctomycetes bacterium CA13]|uniref:Uncharacterized protein n=1 Tax=Novipirellula herctigrandis TaxID=2527986 RepID=A0A5C5YVG3_9BACT|nr:hypothetical protein CA13_01430 [Planctomycetes bacterium CA13]